MTEFQQRVQHIEKTLYSLKYAIQEEQSYLTKANEFKKKIQLQSDAIQYVESHLPSHLPGNQPVQLKQKQNKLVETELN